MPWLEDMTTGRGFIDVRPDYCDPAFNISALEERINRVLRPHLSEFDTVVGTGVSGMLVLPVIAHMFNKSMLAIRQQPSSHHRGTCAGQLGERWIFVDDLVSSGTTLRRVHEHIDKLISASLQGGLNPHPVPQCVGAFLYEEWVDTSDWESRDYSHVMGAWHDHAWLERRIRPSYPTSPIQALAEQEIF